MDQNKFMVEALKQKNATRKKLGLPQRQSQEPI